MNSLIHNPSTDGLIPIFTGTLSGQPIPLCNARELHRFLQIARDFSTWIKKRLDDGGFVENQDYLLTKTGEQLPSGTKYLIDYHLTLETAKHIAMMERNEKGRQVREYFIQCERQALQSGPRYLSLPPDLDLSIPSKRGKLSMMDRYAIMKIMHIRSGGYDDPQYGEKFNRLNDGLKGVTGYDLATMPKSCFLDALELVARLPIEDIQASRALPPPDQSRVLLTLKNGAVVDSRVVEQNHYVLSLDDYRELLERSGFQLVDREEALRLLGLADGDRPSLRKLDS